MGWLSNWKQRIYFTTDITKFDSNLIDFPLTLFLSNNSGVTKRDTSYIFDTIGSNFLKIAITTSDGVSQCYCEVEQWDVVNRKAIIHFKVPFINCKKDEIYYIYFDIDKIDNTEYIGVVGSVPAKLVWDDYFEVVYHMNNDPSVGINSIKDSTSNNIYGSTIGNMTYDNLVDSVAGKGIYLDGVDDGIYFQNLGVFSQVTIEALLFPNMLLTSSGIIISSGTSYNDLYTDLGIIKVKTGYSNYEGGLAFVANYNYAFTIISTGNTGTGDSIFFDKNVGYNWIYIVGTYGADGCLFFQGSPVNNNGYPSGYQSIVASNQIFTIGYNNNSPSHHASFIIDELRISSIERHSHWVKATYYSLFDSIIYWGMLENYHEYVTRWLYGWKYKNIIVIVGADDGDVEEYTMRFVVNHIDGMQSDFSDVRFTADDGVTLLNYWIEYFVPLSVAVFWVKVPYIHSNPIVTFLYLYFDNEDAVSSSSLPSMNIRKITNNILAHKLDEGNYPIILDYSGNEINGTIYGYPKWETDTYGNYLVFDGVKDYVICDVPLPNIFSMNTSNSTWYAAPSQKFWSISFWAKATVTGTIDIEGTFIDRPIGQSFSIKAETPYYYDNPPYYSIFPCGIEILVNTNCISVYGYGEAFEPYGTMTKLLVLAVYNDNIGTAWNYIVITSEHIFMNGAKVHDFVKLPVIHSGSDYYHLVRASLGCFVSYGKFSGALKNVFVFDRIIYSVEVYSLYHENFKFDLLTSYVYTPNNIVMDKYPNTVLTYQHVFDPPEPHILVQTGNIYSTQQYVFTCSVSGVNVYDVTTRHLIDYIPINEVSSVYGNNDYLFVGTTVSGIYKTTISGNHEIEIFKQYPNLTNNNVQYIHVSGNYLCATTLSGIDRYNLDTDERTSTNILWAKKCFQVDNGDYYFETGVELHAMYSDGFSYIYTPHDDRNILQSYSKYDIVNDYSINDIFITKETSSNNDENTIFLATAHGVIVIEEERGDEEYAIRSYYLTSFTEEIDEVVTVTVDEKGYVLGGNSAFDSTLIFNSIHTMSFSNEVFILNSVSMFIPKTYSAGINNDKKGYSVGGLKIELYDGWAHSNISFSYNTLSEILVLVFSNDVSSIIESTLPVSVGYSAGVNSFIKGYLLGGGIKNSYILVLSYLRIVEDFVFSTEISTLLTSCLNFSSSCTIGLSSYAKGYHALNTDYSNTIESFSFYSETSSVIVNVLSPIVSMTTGVGINSEIKGYFMGGYSRDVDDNLYYGQIFDLNFATDTSFVLLTATLTDTFKSNSTGINNSTRGYKIGGGWYDDVNNVTKVSPNIDTFNFGTETSSVIITSANIDISNGTGIQNCSL